MPSDTGRRGKIATEEPFTVLTHENHPTPQYAVRCIFAILRCNAVHPDRLSGSCNETSRFEVRLLDIFLLQDSSRRVAQYRR